MADERDLFANFERMRREIDEMFGDIWERAALTPAGRVGFTPAVDIYVSDDGGSVVIQAELAGVDIREVSVDVKGREVIISGVRRTSEREGRVYHHVEIEHGPFRRSVTVPGDVVGHRAKASYRDGLLKVEVPLVAMTGSQRDIEIDGSQ